ncbi:Hsp20/alpha crystallin family protein [Silvibacterium dinghuense]|uniref:Hsp20/alpha crystallin family protein n=1 Tax=Silvibacterium dinghuense TaxID=1560006 RepID=A0A4Q1SHJ6_9BACT|nr:Hsp20/alpha crystallin family protein [Silvibacterium dinghuense]RXS97058.1 Hsp20/alpha crystallin family protein [Silvibacterium dinghuense]GGG95837.1 molecular chaperone [Silvibacterium dinghuense]
MVITHRDSLRDVIALQNRLNALFSERANGKQNDTAEKPASFVPAVDIFENEQKIVLQLEAPGLKQEDFDIQLENDTLTVRGERKLSAEAKEEDFRRIERRYGSFARSFSIPVTVNQESVKASYDAGVLSIELGKRPEAKPKQIKVN